MNATYRAAVLSAVAITAVVGAAVWTVLKVDRATRPAHEVTPPKFVAMDTALRRPGRLDRTLLVLPPDTAAREAIVRWNLRDRPVEGVREAVIAAKTEGYSGADVAHLCDSAAEIAMEESIQSGHARPIRQADFLKALKEITPSVRPWFDTARNYALFANEGGTYDELLAYLRSQNIL